MQSFLFPLSPRSDVVGFSPNAGALSAARPSDDGLGRDQAQLPLALPGRVPQPEVRRIAPAVSPPRREGEAAFPLSGLPVALRPLPGCVVRVPAQSSAADRGPTEPGAALTADGGARLPAKPVPGDEEAKAQAESERLSDALRAEEIRARMEADARLSRLRIQAIRAELQTEALRIWEEVLLRRQKVMADLFDKWWRATFS